MSTEVLCQGCDYRDIELHKQRERCAELEQELADAEGLMNQAGVNLLEKEGENTRLKEELEQIRHDFCDVVSEREQLKEQVRELQKNTPSHCDEHGGYGFKSNCIVCNGKVRDE
jgi:chromosome segregation ATPase